MAYEPYDPSNPYGYKQYGTSPAWDPLRNAKVGQGQQWSKEQLKNWAEAQRPDWMSQRPQPQPRDPQDPRQPCQPPTAAPAIAIALAHGLCGSPVTSATWVSSVVRPTTSSVFASIEPFTRQFSASVSWRDHVV